MANMADVRRALWRAYEKAASTEYGIDGKASDGWVELRYPTYWECETEDEFLQPCGIMIYSYALGPSRRHYINRGDEDRRVDHNTWESPDIFEKAVEIIESWERNIDSWDNDHVD